MPSAFGLRQSEYVPFCTASCRWGCSTCPWEMYKPYQLYIPGPSRVYDATRATTWNGDFEESCASLCQTVFSMVYRHTTQTHWTVPPPLHTS